MKSQKLFFILFIFISFNCFSSNSLTEKSIEDESVTVNLISWTQSGVVCAGEEFILYDPNLFGFSAVWSNGDQTSNVQNSFLEILPGSYTYSVTVTDPQGCVGSGEIEILVEDCSPCPECPNSQAATGLDCVFIDANLPGMNNIDSWVQTDLAPYVVTTPGLNPVIANVHLIIDGPLELGEHHSFEDCHMTFLDEESSLTPVENQGLTQVIIRDCVLESCGEENWQGILINDNTIVEVIDSEIYDALSAIKIQGNVLRFLVSQNHFENNRIAVETISDAFDFHIVNNVQMWDNDFVATQEDDRGLFLIRSEFLCQNPVDLPSRMTGYQGAPVTCTQCNMALQKLDIEGIGDFESTAVEIFDAFFADLSEITISGHGETGISITGTNAMIALDEINCTGVADSERAAIMVKRSTGSLLEFRNISVEGISPALRIEESDLSDGSFLVDFDFEKFLDPLDQRIKFPIIHLLNSSQMDIGSIGTTNELLGQCGDATLIDYCQNIVVENVIITEVSGTTGIRTINSEFISLRDNDISATLSTDIFSDDTDQLFVCNNLISNSTFGTVIENGTPMTMLMNRTQYLLNEHGPSVFSDLSIRFSAIGDNPNAGNTWGENSFGWIDDVPTIVDNSQFEVNDIALRPSAANIDLDNWFPMNMDGVTEDRACRVIDEINTPSPVDTICQDYAVVWGHDCGDVYYPDCEEMLQILQMAIGGTFPASISLAQQYDLQLILSPFFSEELSPFIASHMANCLEEIETLIPIYNADMGAKIVKQASHLLELRHINKLSTAAKTALSSKEVEADNVRAAIELLDPYNEIDRPILIARQNELSVICNESLIIQKNGEAEITARKADFHQQVSGAGIGSDISSYHEKAIELEAFLLINDLEDLSDAQLVDLTFLSGLCPAAYGHPVYFARQVISRLGGLAHHEYDNVALCAGVQIREGSEQTHITEQMNLASIHPNPAKDRVTVVINDQEVDKPKHLSLMDFNGQALLAQDIDGGRSELKLDLSSYPAGMYYLMISNDKHEQIIKLTILE